MLHILSYFLLPLLYILLYYTKIVLNNNIIQKYLQIYQNFIFFISNEVFQSIEIYHQ